jgi:hypothetical protein
VRREDDETPFWDVLDARDDDCAAGAERVDDVRVVHDLLSHVDRRPVLRERALDGLDSSFDPSAIPSRRREQDPLDHTANVAASCADICGLNRNLNPLTRPQARFAERPLTPAGLISSAPRLKVQY